LKGIIGITGTPGTGKKSIAPLVASRLKLPCVSINDLAQRYWGPGQAEVDTRLLRSRIGRELSGPALLFGHLLPYVLEPKAAELVAVMRCEPSVLKERLLRRGYPQSQVLENVEAELIGVISADSYDAFGSSKTFEVDTTRLDPRRAGEKVTRLLRRSPQVRRIDWTLSYDSDEKLKSLLSG
jgi:adenylate kinase